MKTNKIFGVKSITNLIYGLIVLLPMFAILGRTIYVQANFNAKDSYSDSFVRDIQQINDNHLIQYQTYMFNYKDSNTISLGSPIYYYTSININWSDYTSFSSNQINGFSFYPETNSNKQRIKFWYDETEIGYSNLIWGNTLKSITIVFDKLNTTTNQNQPNFNLYTYIFVNQKLDNAFEYSLSEFTKDNNLGEVDMFGWFTNMFLDTTNAKNQLYVGFVNWYLNYTMLVSSGYLLFLVLIWFINFIRRIMDKSMYQDYGGF